MRGEGCRRHGRHSIRRTLNFLQGNNNCNTSGDDVLEACRGSQASGRVELLDKEPGVGRVKDVDVAGAAVDDSE